MFEGLKPSVKVYHGQNVFIPNSVTKVNFEDLSSIDDTIYLHISNLTPPDVLNKPYQNAKRVMVYVPKKALVTYEKSKWSTFTLYAEPNPVLQVSIDKDSLKMKKGSSAQLSATILPSDADDLSVSWYSSDETIAKVDRDGVITSISSGNATIYVKAEGNPSLIDSCFITVFQPVSEIRLNNVDKKIKVRESFNLMATISPSDADDKSVIWTSSNDSIATVVNGKVTGVKAGTALITATSSADRKITSHCVVNVLQPVEGVELDKSSYLFNKIGETEQLTATVLPEDANNKAIKWKSTAEDVCYVSNGKIVAIGYGTAVIIATTADGGFMATCTVTVNNSTDINELKINKDLSFKIYTVDGKQISKLQKGINIIRFRNGVSKTIIVNE